MPKKRKRIVLKGEWEEVFFAALSQTPVIVEACEAAHVSRKAVQKRYKEDPKFRGRWKIAMAEAIDRVEGRLHQLAMKGSPQALSMYLKAHRKKYRDADKASAPQQGQAVNVHMYMPDNKRDTPKVIQQEPGQIPGSDSSENTKES